jgi:predicted nucleotidyltransferase
MIAGARHRHEAIEPVRESCAAQRPWQTPVGDAMITIMVDPGLLANLRNSAKRLFPSRPILVAYAFGSRIAGSPLPGSDLDVGYYVHDHLAGGALPLREEMLLAAELSDAVGLPVDLRDLGGAPLELRGRVLEEGVRIYSGDDVRRVALERDTLARYHDYKDVFRHMHEIRLRMAARRGS